MDRVTLKHYLTLSSKVKKPFYTWNEIDAITRFQDFGDSHLEKKYKNRLVKLSERLDPSFKKGQVVYRVMGFKPEHEKKLKKGGAILKLNKFSSWTKDIKIAHKFKFDPWFFASQEEGNTIVVAKKKVPSSRVLMDLDALWNDKDFLESYSYWMARERFEHGTDIQDTQREVVLKQVSISKKNIVWEDILIKR